jgi:hypothetical protein
MIHTMGATMAKPRSLYKRYKAMPVSRKLAYISWTRVMPEPMRSISALIRVIASAFSTADELMWSVLLNMRVMRLPRKRVSRRYVLCW